MQIQGNRLGSAYEEEGYADNSNNGDSKNKQREKNCKKDNGIPKPRVDPTLTDSDRIRQRDERLAAVEQRMEQNNNNPQSNKQKKKKKQDTGAPLKGPNSEPLMRWNA